MSFKKASDTWQPPRRAQNNAPAPQSEPEADNAPVVRFPTPESWHAYLAQHLGANIPRAYCKYGCGGAGCFRYDVEVGHPLFGKTKTCQCARERAERTNATQLEQYRAQLSQSEQAFSLSNWVGTDTYALNVARTAAARGWGLVCFYGNFGTAKSGLLTAMVNHALDRKQHARYEVAPTMLRHLRAAYEDDSFEYQFQSLCDVRVLAIDELWRYKETEWAAERMFELLDYRYRFWDRLLTVCATNARPDPVQDSLWSRFTDTQRAQMCEVRGGDLRPLARELAESEARQ
jgi:DNA replication protein DnaC